MCPRVRKKMTRIIISAILILSYPIFILSESIETTPKISMNEHDGFENNIIDFDEEYAVKFNKKYGMVPWHANDLKDTLKYTVVTKYKSNSASVKDNKNNNANNQNNTGLNEEVTTQDYRVIPLELLSTTEDALISIIESTTEPDLTVIPLSTTKKMPNVSIDETVTLPSTTEFDVTIEIVTTTADNLLSHKQTSTNTELNNVITTVKQHTISSVNQNETRTFDARQSNNRTKFTPKPNNINEIKNNDASINNNKTENATTIKPKSTRMKISQSSINPNTTSSKTNSSLEDITTSRPETNSNATDKTKSIPESKTSESEEDIDVPIFTEIDIGEVEDIPEDYYDSKDVIPTSAPKTDAISVLFGLAGSVVESVVESVAERVVPRSIYDLFKRIQRQNEQLEVERLRSREENGGLGQFGRGILKSISTGLSRPFSQLMAGVKEAGSLDTDRGFVGSVASSVTSVASAATNYLEAFKDKVQAIYPGTVWCGDGHSATARSSDLGLFFFTDTCCRQHDACKLSIAAGETKYGLTNTGLFTRSHCSCDQKFRECLRRTNSLVSAQIGLTYFNVLGPQCFRRAHPIVKCIRRTRITGQKCEEYQLDYTKSRMWQWFDNETF